MTDNDMVRLIRRLLRKSWQLVGFAAVCGAVVGSVVTFAVSPTYSAQATVYVAPPISGSATDAVSGDQYAEDRTKLYWQIANNDELARRVAGQLHSTETPAVLASRISASLMHDAPLLVIHAVGPSADAARSLAQAYADQLPDYARSVEQNSGLREGPVLVTVARPVEVIRSNAGAKPWLNVLLSTMFFGGAALLLTMLRRRRHPTVHGRAQLRKALPEPWIVQFDRSPGEIARIRAMLFAAPNSARQVIVASARSDDEMDGVIEEFKTALLPRPRRHLTDVAAVSAPALLDQDERLTALATRSSTGIMISAISSVIMCLKGQTLLEDVVELAKLLSLGGIEVKGVMIVRRPWLERLKVRDSLRRRTDDTDEDWVRIGVVECGRPSQNGPSQNGHGTRQ